MHSERITYVRYPDHVMVSVLLNPITEDGYSNPQLARLVIKNQRLLPVTADERFLPDDSTGAIIHRARYCRMPEVDATDFQRSTAQARLTMAITELVELHQRLGILARNNMLPRNEVCSE